MKKKKVWVKPTMTKLTKEEAEAKIKEAEKKQKDEI